jgi:hypothetical protein
MTGSVTNAAKRPPLWLTSLGVVVTAAVGGALLYALWIAAHNFARIGV